MVMPTTQDIVIALFSVATDLVTLPLIVGLMLLLALTISPRLPHAH